MKFESQKGNFQNSSVASVVLTAHIWPLQRTRFLMMMTATGLWVPRIMEQRSPTEAVSSKRHAAWELAVSDATGRGARVPPPAWA